MTVGVRIDSEKGPVTTKDSQGLTVGKDTANVGFSPWKVETVTALTGSTTLVAGNAGVLTVSGTAALTQSLPTAASCVGAELVIRSLSAHAHVVTGSQETAGTKAIILQISGATNGSRVTLPATVGSSVILKSDGVNFHVMSFSGSITVNGT